MHSKITILVYMHSSSNTHNNVHWKQM